MKHLMTVLEIKHLDRNGKVIWERRGLKNLIHSQGEQYCLTALFNTENQSIPANYFAGLDNRTTPALSDTLANLSQEPTQFGYARQAITSGSGFSIALNSQGVYQATSNILIFNATGGSWGPVRNVFLATSSNNTGKLICTAPLDGPHTVVSGEQMTLRIALTLKDLGEDVEP